MRSVGGGYAAALAAYFAVGVAFHVGAPVLVPGVAGLFGNATVFRPWPGGVEAYMLFHPVWFVAVFVAGYAVLRPGNVRLAGWRGGLRYAAGVLVVGSLPVYAVVFAAVQLPPEIAGLWAAQSICQYLAAGAAVGQVFRVTE